SPLLRPPSPVPLPPSPVPLSFGGMSEPVVVDRVTKRFAGHTAVDALSLSVSAGIIYGLLGPNGAGKTTTLRMIMDIYEPDSGSIRLFDQVGGGRTHSARIGYLPEERGLYPRMRVLDVLVFLAEAKGVSRRVARVKALEWLERLGLSDWRLRKVSGLHKGMQQKVQFISTILHDPDLVILDEPFAGLDPVNSQVLRDTVVDYRRHARFELASPSLHKIFVDLVGPEAAPAAAIGARAENGGPNA